MADTSNPHYAESDSDGYNDEEETKPFSQRLDEVKQHIKQAADYAHHRKTLLRSLDEFGELLDIVLQDKLSEDEAEHFKEAGFKSVVQTYRVLLKARGFGGDHECSSKVAALSRQCVDLSLKYLKKNNTNVGYLLYDIFNADRMFYQETNSRDERLREEGKPLEDDEIDEEFFKNIKKQTMYDYYDPKLRRWKTGWLCTIHKNNACFSRCMPIHDNNYDTIERDPHYLAPCHSHFPILENEPWRKELDKGSKVDLLDMVSKWYSAEVVETNLGGELLTIKFEQWSAQYNRKLLRTDPRIQPPGSLTKDSQAVENWNFKNEDTELAAYYRPQTSPFLVDIVNYFQKVGGFDWILERLSQYDPIMPFEALHVLPCFLCKCCNVFSNSFAEYFIPKFKDSMFNSLLNMTDVEMRDLKIDWLDRIKSHSPKLFQRIYTKKNSHKLIEEFMLDMALKRLQSNVVERRINGLVYLTETCSSLRSLPQYHQQQIVPQHVDSEILADWLERKEVFDVLFNEKTTHIQLVKRSADLFKLMISEKRFGEKHLDLVWEAVERAMKAENNDIEELTTIYKLLEDICRTLQMESQEKLFDHLFSKIESVPQHLILPQTVDLLNLFTKTESTCKRALAVLWSIMTDDNASHKILTYTREKVQEVLKKFQFRSRRREYMVKCVEFIKEHQSVPQCCYLLKECLHQIQQSSAYRSNDSSCSETIEALNKEYGLMQAIFDDIASFKKESSALVNELKTEEEKNGSAIGAFPYSEHIECRLDLLNFALGASDLRISEGQADVLWDSFILNGVTTIERQTALHWFKQAVMSLGRRSEFKVMTVEVAMGIFDQHIQKMDPGKIDLAAYSCLEQFFLSVNAARKVMRLYDDNATFDVLNFNDLQGVDLFWEIAFNVSDQTVKDAAIRFLNQIHSSVENEDMELQESIQTSYLERVMKQIRKGFGERHEEHVDRCLDLIGKLLDMSEVHGLSPNPCHGSTSEGHLLGLSVRNNCVYPRQFMNITLYDNQTVWDLRRRIAKVSGCRARDVKLSITGTGKIDAEKNACTLKAVGIRNKSSVVAVKTFRPSDLIDVSTPQNDIINDLKRALNHIFRRYSQDGATMNLYQLQKYMYDCGGEEDNEEKAKEMCRKWSQDDRSFSLVGFFKLYRNAVNTGRAVDVFSDLSCQGYGPDLKEITEKQEEVDEPIGRKLPRDLISENAEYFDLLFDHGLKLGGHISERTWEILLRIPTNRKKMETLFQMENMKSKEDWLNFFQKKGESLSPYQTLYCLMIFEYLLNDDTEGHAWAKQFLHNGGVEYFYEVIHTVTFTPDAGGESSVDRQVFLLMLRLVHKYLISSLRKKDTRPFVKWGVGAAEIVSKIQKEFEDQVEKFGLAPYEPTEELDDAVSPEEEVAPVEMSNSISLKEEDEAKVKQFFNHKNLSDRLLKVLEITSVDEVTATSADLVQLASELWILLVGTSKDAAIHTLDEQKSRIFNILHSADIKVQATFCKALGELCVLTKCNNRLLNHLVGALPEKSDSHPQFHFKLAAALLQVELGKETAKAEHFKDLFQMVQDHLLKHRTSETEEKVDEVLCGLLRIWLLLLMYFKDFRARLSDKLEQIFYQFLFALGKDEEEIQEGLPKCKAEESREMCLNLLVQSCIDTPKNAQNLFKLVESLVAEVDTPYGWDKSPESDIRQIHGAGLHNLGSTCYMNSVIQQFYHLPRIRHGMLASQSRIYNHTDTVLYQLQKLFSFLTLSEKQAVEMIDFTRNYTDEAGNPVDVRIQQDAFEFWSGILNKTSSELKHSYHSNILQHEFGFQILTLMQCQGGCAKVSERSSYKDSLGLNVKNKTGMKEGLELHNMPEELTEVQCDHCNKKCTKTRRDVLGSLPNTLVVHLKRFELNYETFRHEKVNSRWEFPTELDLYEYTKEGLQRAELLQKAEEDSSVDVPEKYSSPGRPKEYYEYRLHGIVIHTGNAEAGHYYSFIKDRGSGKWHEFNDHLVKPFDLSTLEEECFGGSIQLDDDMFGKRKGQWSNLEDNELTEQIKNAYLLVYDRVKEFDYEKPPEVKEEKAEDEPAKKDPIPPNLEKVLKDLLCENLDRVLKHPPVKRAFGVADEDVLRDLKTEDTMGQWVDQIIKQPQVVECFKKHHGEEKDVPDNIMKDAVISVFVRLSFDKYPPEPERQPPDPATPFIDLITEEVEDEVLEDNKSFSRERHVFNTSFFRFTLNTFRIYDQSKDVDDRLIENAVRFCFDTLARSGDKREDDLFHKFLSYIKTMLRNSPRASKWFLREFCLGEVVSRMSLIATYSLQCRDHTVIDGFTDLVSTVLLFLQEEEEDHLDEANQSGFVCASSNLIHRWLTELPSTTKYWMRFQRYFWVLRKWCEMGHKQRNFLLRYGALKKLLTLFLEQTSSTFNALAHHRLTPPKWEHLLEVIVLLLRQCRLSDIPPTQIDYSPLTFEPYDKLFKVDASLRLETLMKKTYRRTVENSYDNVNLSNILRIVQLMVWENPNFSNDVVLFIIKGVEAVGPDQVWAYMRLMYAVVQLDDTLYGDRIRKLHAPRQGVLHHIYFFRKPHAPFSLACIEQLIVMMSDIPQYRENMKEIREQWQWMDEWLKRQCNVNHSSRHYSRGAQKLQIWEKYTKIVEDMGFTISVESENDENFMVDSPVDDGLSEDDEEIEDIYGSSAPTENVGR